jgi:hypothetical protein
MKVKCSLVETLRLCTARTAHRGSRGIALFFHDHGTRRGEGLASRTGRSLPRERPGTHCTGSWVGPRAGLDRCGKFASTGIRSPDRPSRNQSLYRLRYPAHSLLARRAKLNLENQILVLHRKPNRNLVPEEQQDSLENSYRRSKGKEMAIITALSGSAPKDSRVGVVGRCRGNGKENMEDMSSPKKHEMPTEILPNESEAWLVRSKETVTPQPR